MKYKNINWSTLERYINKKKALSNTNNIVYDVVNKSFLIENVWNEKTDLTKCTNKTALEFNKKNEFKLEIIEDIVEQNEIFRSRVLKSERLNYIYWRLLKKKKVNVRRLLVTIGDRIKKRTLQNVYLDYYNQSLKTTLGCRVFKWTLKKIKSLVKLYIIEQYFSSRKKLQYIIYKNGWELKSIYSLLKKMIHKKNIALDRKKCIDLDRKNRLTHRIENKWFQLTDSTTTLYDLYKSLKRKKGLQYIFNRIKKKQLNTKTNIVRSNSNLLLSRPISWSIKNNNLIEQTSKYKNENISLFFSKLNESHWAFKYLVCQLNLSNQLKLMPQLENSPIAQLLNNYNGKTKKKTIKYNEQKTDPSTQDVNTQDIVNKAFSSATETLNRSQGANHIINILQDIIDPNYKYSESKLIEDEMIRLYKSEEEESKKIRLIYKYQDKHNAISLELNKIDYKDDLGIEYINIDEKKNINKMVSIISKTATLNTEAPINIQNNRKQKNNNIKKETAQKLKADKTPTEKWNEELMIEDQKSILANDNSRSISKYVEQIQSNLSTNLDVNQYFEHYEGLDIDESQSQPHKYEKKEKSINLDTDYDSLDLHINLEKIEIEMEEKSKQHIFEKTIDDPYEYSFLEIQTKKSHEIYNTELKFSSHKDVDWLTKSKWSICYRTTSVERVAEKLIRKEISIIPFYTKKYLFENKWFLEYNVFNNSELINNIYKEIILSEIINKISNSNIVDNYKKSNYENQIFYLQQKVEFRTFNNLIDLLNITSIYTEKKEESVYKKTWNHIYNINRLLFWEYNNEYFNDWGKLQSMNVEKTVNETNNIDETSISIETNEELALRSVDSNKKLNCNSYFWGQSLMYQDIYVKKFINFFMRSGKKETAYKIFYSVLSNIKNVTGLSAIRYIKTLFASTTNYFSYSQIMLKNKSNNKMSFFNRNKRKYYLYHLFFKELKTIYIEEYVSIVDKMSYLILKNMYDTKVSQWESSFDSQIEEIYKERHSFLQTSVKKISESKAIPHTILNYKKKY